MCWCFPSCTRGSGSGRGLPARLWSPALLGNLKDPEKPKGMSGRVLFKDADQNIAELWAGLTLSPRSPFGPTGPWAPGAPGLPCVESGRKFKMTMIYLYWDKCYSDCRVAQCVRELTFCPDGPGGPNGPLGPGGPAWCKKRVILIFLPSSFLL